MKEKRKKTTERKKGRKVGQTLKSRKWVNGQSNPAKNQDNAKSWIREMGKCTMDQSSQESRCMY